MKNPHYLHNSFNTFDPLTNIYSNHYTTETIRSGVGKYRVKSISYSDNGMILTIKGDDFIIAKDEDSSGDLVGYWQIQNSKNIVLNQYISKKEKIWVKYFTNKLLHKHPFLLTHGLHLVTPPLGTGLCGEFLTFVVEDKFNRVYEFDVAVFNDYMYLELEYIIHLFIIKYAEAESFHRSKEKRKGYQVEK